MPRIRVETSIGVPLNAVWAAMLDIESFPHYMPNVLSARVQANDGTSHRVSAWSALLKGSVLEWVEDELIDSATHQITFKQIDGDLDVYEGTWSASAAEGGTVVKLDVEFDIGIPLLADMLNPVAERALRDNHEKMLRALEERVLSS